MVFADRAVVLDHRTGTTYLLTLAEDGDETAARAWLRTTTAELARLAEQAPTPCPAPAGLTGPDLRPRHDRDAYLKLIDVCHEEIRAA